ncbi:hypothetical protein LOC68_16520 [Blastopirellula sp. JC732]|uniref:Uncharacterized protein n=1 Tax=Blastopirellula sediminis TaxID=2894196 RepID=A0A9X1SH27_9BACT|nr:hypothetical protein [Blastopirellula sediminis]MCC9606705.1 hypothetical protein [Blastopirellula sediminis]MCC9629998.1 hypothetical protein [Blastopirellula sediminis]
MGLVEEPPETRAPIELVYAAIVVLLMMTALFGLLLGLVIGKPGVWNEVTYFLAFAMLIPLGIITVLYQSVFRRARLPMSSGSIWLMPVVYGLIMLLLCLGLPFSIPVMIAVSLLFWLVYLLVKKDLEWQRYLVEHDVPPRSGFTLRELMMGFVGLSIALAIARMVVAGMS